MKFYNIPTLLNIQCCHSREDLPTGQAGGNPVVLFVLVPRV